jgi:hypothetical protein
MPEDYTNYTVNYPHQAAWLVYINGLEVPVTTVNVDFGVNKIPTCTIEMPPDPRLARLGYEDRVEVAVFYLDEFFDPYNAEFCLMGEFDIMGWAYTNSASGRSLRFMCVGTAQILQQLNMFYISSVDDIVSAFVPPAATDASTVTAGILYFPASLFLQGLMPTQKAASDLEGDAEVVQIEEFITTPYQFIHNVFKAMLSNIDTSGDPNRSASASALPANATSAPGKNFFARYMMKRDLHRRFVGLPYIDNDLNPADKGCFPIIKATQSTEALKAIQSQLGSAVGPSGSIWELLRMMLGTMFMEVVTIPAPPIAMAESDTGVMRDVFKNKRKTTVGDKTLFGVIAANFIKPQCYFGLPPTCNVIFPSMLQNLSLEEDYTNQPTRVYLGEQFLANLIAGKATSSAQQLVSSTLTTGFPPMVDSRMRQYTLATSPSQNTKNFLIWPEEFFRGPVTRQLSAPPWLYLLDKYRNSLKTLPSTEGEQGFTTGAVDIETVKRYGPQKFGKWALPRVEYWSGKVGGGISPNFVMARMWKESNFSATATSVTTQAGVAKGALQLVDDAVTTIWPQVKNQEPAWKDVQPDPFNPEMNIAMGVAHLADSCKKLKVSPSSLGNQNDLLFVQDKPVTGAQLIMFSFAYGADGATTSAQALQNRILGEVQRNHGGTYTEKNKAEGKIPPGKKVGDWRAVAGTVIDPGKIIKTQADAAKAFPQGTGKKAQTTPGFQKLVTNAFRAWSEAQNVLAGRKHDEGPKVQVATKVEAPVGPNTIVAGSTPGGTFSGPKITAEEMAKEEALKAKAAADKQIPDPAKSPTQPEEEAPGAYGEYESNPDNPGGTFLPDKMDELSSEIAAQIAAETAMAQQEIANLGNLFRTYAMYEYFRSRFESRVGAAI